MANTKTQAGMRVGQTVSYRGQAVRIKAFPSRYTAVVVPEPFAGAGWVAKTVAMSELR